MVNTRASKRKSRPANNCNVASAKRTHRDVSDDEEVGSDHPAILIQPRENEFSAKTCWMVDLSFVEEASLQGASALVKRCMRTYSWDETKARKVLAAYRQFIILKKELKDWDAKIQSPCHLVDQMWHCHILDVVNYCHDMMLLCGHIVGHNPDGALDSAAKQWRDLTTRVSLRERFRGYDYKIWYAPHFHNTELRYDDIPNERGGAAINDSMRIIIIDQMGEEVMFNNVRSTVKMVKLFDKYAANKGADVLAFRFLLDGDRIEYDATPASLDLEDGDRIDCWMQQCGC